MYVTEYIVLNAMQHDYLLNYLSAQRRVIFAHRYRIYFRTK